MSTAKGNKGEQHALKYLKKNKYHILDKNFHSKFGEIDIIAQEDDTIIFVEVKYRNTNSYETAAGAVHPQKRKKIIQTAQYWISLQGIEVACRFDVIAINDTQLEHIKNAFTV